MRLSLLLLLVLIPLPLLAAPAVTCHCFQDRAFDPQRPQAADAYFLATLQNSLFAAVSGTDKRAVVQAKMAGAAGDELWVRWALTAPGQTSQAEVDALRDAGRSWREVARQLHLPLDRFDPALTKGLLRGAQTAELAALVVDAVLRTRLGATAESLARLRRDGADDRQTIAAVFLARRSGGAPHGWLAAVQQRGESWSGLLLRAGVEAGTVETALAGLLHN